LQQSFERLNERQAKEREEFERDAEENYINITAGVEEAITFANESSIFKEARERLIDTQNSIKGIKLKREHRDQLYSRIREVFDELNQRQTDEMTSFNSECEENYEKLVQRLEQIIDEINNNTDFALNREKLIALQSEIKILRLKKNQRNELFAKTREAFNIFDRRRKEHRERISREKLDKLTSIKLNLDAKIQRLVDSINWDIRSLTYQKEKLESFGEDDDPTARKEIVEIIVSIENRIADKQSNIEEIKSRIHDIQNELEKL
jgi:hypothetical protein